MSTKSETNLAQLLADMNAGVFSSVVEGAISATALGVVNTGRKGRVAIILDMKRIGESNQVAVTHAIKTVTPTTRGKQTEDFAMETPMHVGPRGALSLFPHEQTSLNFNASKERA